MLVLLLLALVLHAAAVRLFARRDIGGVVRLPVAVRHGERAATRPPALPASDWSLNSVFTRGLGMLVVPAAWWTLVTAGFAAWMVVVVHHAAATLNNLLAGSPSIAAAFQQLGGQGASLDAALLDTMFLLLPIFLMAFAVTQVSRWAADEDDGRLDLLLATPRPRAAVLLGRFAALACAIAAMALVTLLAAALAAVASGLPLAAGRLAAACVGMIPLALLIAAL
ncbi:MAG: ABC transporter permease subunit, partial [Chloroflexota bacterium]